jgi:O-antigen/teichoic acid export membrane protein
MASGPSKRKIAQGVAWASSAQWGGQLMSFGIYTGLARLLNPQVFGLVAIAGVYVALIQVFVQQGFGTAIIQREELEREHVDSAFWIAMAAAAVFSLLSILLAGDIAKLFHEPKVAPVIGWLSLSLLLYALSSVPTALLTREMDFRPLAIRSLAATAAGGAVGLAMAYYGWGVWSLVGQQLVNSALACVCLWSAVPWRPSFRVSRRHLRDLYGFSLNIAGNDLLWFFSQKSDQTLVGYGFGPLGLGPYSLASRLVTLLHDAIIGPVQSVALPTFSKLQSDPSRLERALHKFCEMSSFLALPMFAGLIVVAPELVPLLFGAKWTTAVPILQVLAVYAALRAIFGFVHPLMIAKGRPGLYLSMFVIQSCLTLVGCLVAVRWDPKAIALSMVVTMAIFAVFTFVVPMKIIKINVPALLKTFAFPGLLSLFMLAVVAWTRSHIVKTFPPLITMLICILTGVIAYVLAAFLIRPDLVNSIREMVGTGLLTRTPRDRVVSAVPAVPDQIVE